MFDSDSYHQGVIRVATNLADEAIRTAFSAAFSMYGYDHPLTQAIKKLQDDIRSVHELNRII